MEKASLRIYLSDPEVLLRGGIKYIFLAEVVFDPARLFLNAAQDADRGPRQSQFRSGWGNFGHPALEIGVQQLVGVQFWRVAGQIEHLDLVCVSSKPFPHSLRMMDSQVVQDQENSLLPSIDKPLHEANHDLRVHRSGEDLPAHPPLVGHR